jgi:hypothetical protein
VKNERFFKTAIKMDEKRLKQCEAVPKRGRVLERQPRIFIEKTHF